MKKHIIGVFSLLMLSSQLTFGQNVPDQNPRYQESQDKYQYSKDGFIPFQGTTIQDTYKAYDWREAKAEKQAARRSFRHQLRLEEARNRYYNYNYTPTWSPYYSPYNNYYWGNRYHGRPFYGRSQWHMGLGVGF